MTNLLEIYDSMLEVGQQKAEEAFEKNAEEAVVGERIEILTKYASAADDMLAEEYGEDFTEDDVKELATYFIENDTAVEEQQEKVAEYHQLGVIMAKAFKSELELEPKKEEN